MAIYVWDTIQVENDPSHPHPPAVTINPSPRQHLESSKMKLASHVFDFDG